MSSGLVTLIAMGLVLAGIAYYMQRKMQDRRRNERTVIMRDFPTIVFYDVVASDEEINTYAANLRAQYKKLWPCLEKAYGVTTPKESPLVRVEIVPDINGHYYGMTLFYPIKGVIRLVYSGDPNITSPWCWEVRNLFRVYGRQDFYAHEFDTIPGDDAADDCVQKWGRYMYTDDYLDNKP